MKLGKKTLTVMISMYCTANHRDMKKTNDKLCTDCFKLEQYALLKLQQCPFGIEKPNCTKCPVHCYSKEMRDKILVTMRYSGPRMVLRHPILSTFYLFNNARKITPSG